MATRPTALSRPQRECCEQGGQQRYRGGNGDCSGKPLDERHVMLRAMVAGEGCT
jgi:hypothetical protein